MERSRSGAASNCLSPSQTFSITSSSAGNARFGTCFSRISSHTCSTGLSFWTVRWLRDQPHVLWHDQRFGARPARAIHLQDDELLGEGAADLLEKQLHHRRVGRGQDQGRHFPLGWCDGGRDGGGLPHDLPGSAWSDARWRPCPSGDTHPTKPPFIFGHLQHRSLIVWGTRGERRLDGLFEVFLNAAWSVFVGFRMEGAWGELAPAMTVEQA
jgi:hypothetical protein